MNNLIDAAFSFPALVFTITTIFFMGFWAVTTALGAGISSLDDFDLDFDADVDADVDIDTAADGSTIAAVRRPDSIEWSSIGTRPAPRSQSARSSARRARTFDAAAGSAIR